MEFRCSFFRLVLFTEDVQHVVNELAQAINRLRCHRTEIFINRPFVLAENIACLVTDGRRGFHAPTEFRQTFFSR